MATWQELDQCEKWDAIDRILALVAERLEQERAENLGLLTKKYDIATEARVSQTGKIMAIVQGMRNDLRDIERQL
jgi:hypothetical protein